MMRILIGYDGSESADAALDDLGRAGLPREAEVLVVSVGEGSMLPPPSSYEVVGVPITSQRAVEALAQAQALQSAQALDEAKGLAAKAGDRVRSCFPGWEVRTEGLIGWPSLELIRKADEWKPDLVVVGSRGRSAVGSLILGSVSKKVVTDSYHSVRVARGAVGGNPDTPPRVMIGVDGSPEAEGAVRSVGRRVWPEGTEVRIVAVDDGTRPARIASILPAAAEMKGTNGEEGVAMAAHMMIEWAESELRAIGLQVSVAILVGDAQRVLIEEARKWEADSIFVGSRRFSGAFERFWLGSVSTALVTKAHCSVEVVRS